MRIKINCLETAQIQCRSEAAHIKYNHNKFLENRTGVGEVMAMVSGIIHQTDTIAYQIDLLTVKVMELIARVEYVKVITDRGAEIRKGVIKKIAHVVLAHPIKSPI